MPEANGSDERSFNEREDKQLQRAVLAFLLDEFPARHTKITLWWMGFGDLDGVERAIRALDSVGLLRRDDVAVVPSAAARHFDWLELS